MIKSLIQKIIRRNYEPLNKLLISEQRISQNLHTLCKIKPNLQIAPVLKSNAYGHGLVLMAKVIEQHFPLLPFICVDSIFEAFLLQKAGVKSEILVMGAVDRSRLAIKNLSFNLTITDESYIDTLKECQPQTKMHLFIDTGMNREGIRMDQLENVLKKIKSANLNIVGIMTHLAVANDKKHPLTRQQIENFQKAKKIITDYGFTPKWWHIGGGDAVSWIDPELCNIVRCGRVLYGVDANGHSDLTPIMQVQTTIVQIKTIKKGETIGYFATYKAQKDLKTAVLPIGYNDGVDKRLSNKGIVKINGHECPIVGLISMNMTVVDVTGLPDLKIGDKAVVFSNQADEKNSIESAAKLVETNPSDLLVGLHPSTRRELE